MAAARVPDGMEEPGMDREAPARPLNCVETEATVGAACPWGPRGQASVSNSEDTGGSTGRELVDLKIIWNKTKHDMKFPLDSTGSKPKQKIHWITHLPPAMQKVMHKGLIHEDKTLIEIRVTSGTKIMVVGSTINDVLAVHTPKDAAQQDAKVKKQHREVLDKGKPEDVMPSVSGAEECMPTVLLSGMYNKLTIKLEQDQLWIGTKEQTEELPVGSIKKVVSEPIEVHEDYHIMAFQLGPIEASYYWVY
uniref:Ubiquitin-like domain-containing protein n=1 Tax=Cebus imitator TaxID=2715852 RepID=A0A2K5RLT2_CEBIM